MTERILPFSVGSFCEADHGAAGFRRGMAQNIGEELHSHFNYGWDSLIRRMAPA